MGHADSVFSFQDIEVSYKANHEVVRIDMAFQIILFRLLDIAYVSYAHIELSDGKVERQPLPERRAVVQGGKRHVLPSMLQ